MTRPTKSVLQAHVDQKLSDTQIAAIFNVTPRTVLRWRDADQIASQWEPRRSPHGTYASYARGCRCTDCTKANTEYCRRYTGAKPRVEPAHGTFARYKTRRCRCDDCRAANAARIRAYRSRAVQ